MQEVLTSVYYCHPPMDFNDSDGIKPGLLDSCLRLHRYTTLTPQIMKVIVREVSGGHVR